MTSDRSPYLGISQGFHQVAGAAFHSPQGTASSATHLALTLKDISGPLETYHLGLIWIYCDLMGFNGDL